MGDDRLYPCGRRIVDPAPVELGLSLCAEDSIAVKCKLLHSWGTLQSEVRISSSIIAPNSVSLYPSQSALIAPMCLHSARSSFRPVPAGTTLQESSVRRVISPYIRPRMVALTQAWLLVSIPEYRSTNG